MRKGGGVAYPSALIEYFLRPCPTGGKHVVCRVWNMIKQSKYDKTRHDTTHTYDRYYIRTHVYVFLFSVKKTRV